MMVEEAYARFGKSKFRSRFGLTAADRAYIDRVGMARLATESLGHRKLGGYDTVCQFCAVELPRKVGVQGQTFRASFCRGWFVV